MIYLNVDADQIPEKVTLENLPGGAIVVRMSDNINEYSQEEAKDRTMYRFDESQFFMPDGKTATAQEIEADFATWWQYGANDTHPDPSASEEEAMTPEQLTKAVSEQKEQIATLEECIMEMSEVMYK